MSPRTGVPVPAVFCLPLLLVALPVVGQDRAERAQELKQWRADCTDPDADLRFATLEAAVATDDRAIRRICMKSALDDDDIEVRRLALALALASAERLVLEFGPSEEMQSALAKAGSKREDVKAVWSDYGYTAAVLANSEGVLVLAPSDVDAPGPVTRWLVIGPNGKAHESYDLTLTQVGSRLDGNGQVLSGAAYTVTVRLELATGGQLVGIIAAHGGEPFPASISLY